MLEQDSSFSSQDSNEEGPPAPLPLPVTTDFYHAATIPESPFNFVSSDYCTDPHSENSDSGTISMDADGTLSSGISIHLSICISSLAFTGSL